LRLHNTLSGRVEEFTPQNGNDVLMYVCGITPYAESHVGHAMSYTVFDVLRRYLEYRGYNVRHVQNYTDIDDKLIARAEREGVPMSEIAERYMAEFQRDAAALNLLPAHIFPRATDEIPAIVDMIRGLVEKGYAYRGIERNGGSDIYFRVEKVPDYGKLSRRSLDSMLAGARIEPLEGKENPMDFTLWKAAKPGEPAWDSPWGPGRPGWHIECSAMSLRHLGPQIDLHGGGLDLMFPHHENEIAQTEAFTGEVPFALFWVHNGFVQFGEEKMSKSLGNFITMRQAIDTYGPDGVRVFVLSSGYRSPLTYSEEAMAAGKAGAERLRNALAPADAGTGEPVPTGTYRERFIAAMEDDFNTAQALGVLFELGREINRGRDAGRPVGGAQSVLAELAGVLGLRLEASDESSIAAAPFIELLIALRKELREAKQYQLADRIRSGLGELGIALEDGPSGTTWKQR
jgi:cysteinyl-tRNA synthetase